jgi:DNA-binding transcriptional regulator YiaG
MNAITVQAELTAPMTAAEVKQARLALGFTSQQQLADALGLTGKYSKDTVRSWETGRTPISGPSRLALRMMLRERGLLERTTPKRGVKQLQTAPQQP